MNEEYSRSIANSQNVIQGTNYRFTILSQRLIRMEFNEEGQFLDKPTVFALYRDNEKFRFEVQDNDR